MGKISVSLIALVAILAALGDAMALGENIVASKAYVDTKQNEIAARATKIDPSDTSFSPSVVTNGATAGDVGQMAIITAARMGADDLWWDEYANNESLIPTLGAVGEMADAKQDKIIANNSTTYPNGSIVTYGANAGEPGAKKIVTTASANGTDIPTDGAVVSAINTAVSNKQDKIVASGWQDNNNTIIPGVVLSSNETGTVSQRMLLDKTNNISSSAIANLVASGYDVGGTDTISFDIHDNSVSAADVNSAVPTTTMTVAIANAAADAAVSNKQDKIAANNSTNYPNGSIVTYGANAGEPGAKKIVTTASANGTDIPTDGAIISAINTAIPAGTAGNVVTYSGTAGTVSSAAVADGPTYDATTGALDNGDDIASINAVTGASALFFGVSSTGADTKTKEVSIPAITSLKHGQIIVVKPTVTNSATGIKIQLNNFTATSINYKGDIIDSSTKTITWTAHVPSVFAYDNSTGTGYWRFVGHGADNNTTYSVMSSDEGIAGTSANARTMSAQNLKAIIQGTKLSGLDTTSATTVAATDSVLGGIGKLQAQITNVSGNLPTGTSGSVVTYDGLDANNVQQYSENAIASAPVYENGTLSNPNSLATISAVETKQNKIAANNSTTYPNGSVVTYGATAGVPGQVAIANAPAYNQSTGALTNGTDIASVAAVNTAVNAAKPVCVGWETGHENNDAYCYFWSVPE